MADQRPHVLIIGTEDEFDVYLQKVDLDRLAVFADWQLLPCREGEPLDSDGGGDSWLDKLAGIEAMVLLPGTPRIDHGVMERATDLRIVGELNSDRFARGVDIETAWERGIRVVDTTNGSSYPVAEWALGLILVSLRNAGYYMRRFLEGNCRKERDNPAFLRGELTGKKVGLIGCGLVGRRLLELLQPFRVDVFAYDPYLPAEMADALGFVQTSLEYVMSQTDAIVCVAPLTPKTRGMIGRQQLELIPSGAVLVNVSRGPIIDSEALVERLKRGDIIAGLDVFEPEPIPAGHEIIDLENVFHTPHIAGVTAAAYMRFFELMVDELDRFFAGHQAYYELTPRSLANRRGTELSHE